MPDGSLRVAVMVDRFPVVSETFVLDQVTALLALGHQVDVYARWRPEDGTPVHPDVAAAGLESRCTYVDERLPPESGRWELPALPPDGQTWVPGAATPLDNRERWRAAAPVLARCRTRSPSATDEVLDPAAYGYQAASLSALHRLDVLAGLGRSYDVVHAHFGPAANTFRFARLLWDAPLVATFHGYDVGAFAQRQGPGLYDHLLRVAAQITVNSRYTRRRLRELSSVAVEPVVLPVGVDLDRLRPRQVRRQADGPLHVLVVARLVPVKGLHHLVQAVAEVARHRPVRLEVVGDGPLRPQLEDLARRLLPAGQVRFRGARSSAHVREQLARADVLVLPSVPVDGDEEAQGLVLQEAQATGLPVVATRTGGIPEGVTDGVTGLLVPPGDPGALARALLRLAADPTAREAMGRAGRRLVEERFDRWPLARRLVEVYRTAVADVRLAQVPG